MGQGRCPSPSSMLCSDGTVMFLGLRKTSTQVVRGHTASPSTLARGRQVSLD